MVGLYSVVESIDCNYSHCVELLGRRLDMIQSVSGVIGCKRGCAIIGFSVTEVVANERKKFVQSFLQ